jgi:hypothetical protein
MAQRERIVEMSYYISSPGSDASPHRVLDVAFREDESRIRENHAPEHFAVLRHMAFNLLQKEPSVKSIKRKRLRAGTVTALPGSLPHNATHTLMHSSSSRREAFSLLVWYKTVLKSLSTLPPGKRDL